MYGGFLAGRVCVSRQCCQLCRCAAVLVALLRGESFQGSNDAWAVHALEYVQRGFICAEVAMPVQSHQPAPSNVTKRGGSLGATVRLCRAAGQGALAAGRCWVWEGARLC